VDELYETMMREEAREEASVGQPRRNGSKEGWLLTDWKTLLR
jgi:hypothetical protein